MASQQAGWALTLLAECRPIFYIVFIPPHAGGCGCVPVQTGRHIRFEAIRRFPCFELAGLFFCARFS